MRSDVRFPGRLGRGSWKGLSLSPSGPVSHPTHFPLPSVNLLRRTPEQVAYGIPNSPKSVVTCATRPILLVYDFNTRNDMI